MALSIKPINWQIFLLHLLAIPFLIIGSQQLEVIRWLPMIGAYQANGVAGMQQQSGPDGLGGTISQMWMSPLYAWALAILAGCLLSMLVVWRRGESKLIPVLLFVLATVTSWTRYYRSEVVFNGLASLRGLLPHLSVKNQLLFVGISLVLIGLLPFLLTWNRRYYSVAAPTGVRL